MQFHITNFTNANRFRIFIFISQFPVYSACHNTWELMNTYLSVINRFCYIEIWIPTWTFEMTLIYLIVIRGETLQNQNG